MKLLIGRLRAHRAARVAPAAAAPAAASTETGRGAPCPPGEAQADVWCEERRSLDLHLEGIGAAISSLPRGELRARLEAVARDAAAALDALDALTRGRPYDDRLAGLVERVVAQVGALHSRLRLIGPRDHTPPRDAVVAEDARRRANSLARLVETHADGA